MRTNNLPRRTRKPNRPKRRTPGPAGRPAAAKAAEARAGDYFKFDGLGAAGSAILVGDLMQVIRDKTSARPVAAMWRRIKLENTWPGAASCYEWHEASVIFRRDRLADYVRRTSTGGRCED